MQLRRIVRGSLLVTVLLCAVAGISGCGGDWYEDDYYDGYYYDDGYYHDDHRYDYDSGSNQKTLFVYLNVGDQDGEALEGVTVWFDGSQQEDRTEATYSRLGDQFPPDWAGWRHNWSGGPFWIDLRDCSNRRCTIEILVSRSGYETQRTTITLEQADPDEIYMRQTFVMEQQVAPAAADSVVDAPRAAEMISLTDPDWQG